MVRIDIKALRPGSYEYDWILKAEDLNLDPDIFMDLKAKARLDFLPARIFVTLNTYAKVGLVCDRTLVEFEQPVEGKYHIMFAGTEMLEGSDMNDEGIRLLEVGDEEIDLTDIVRDTIMLSLPHRALSPGAEDQEMQMKYGQDELPIDPRWEALKNLSSSTDPEEEEE